MKVRRDSTPNTSYLDAASQYRVSEPGPSSVDDAENCCSTSTGQVDVAAEKAASRRGDKRRRMTDGTMWRAAAHRVAILALVASGCSSTTSTTNATVRAPSTNASANEIAANDDGPAIPNEPSAVILRQQRLYDEPDPLGPLQETFGVAPALLPPGQHTTDVLGIDLTLHLDRWWRLDEERPGSLNLVRPDDPVAALLPALLIQRPVGIAPVDRVADSSFLNGEQTYPAADLEQWLQSVEQIEILAAGTANVGGRQAQWWDVRLDRTAGPVLDSCIPGECILAWWTGGSPTTVTRALESLRYYLVPDPEGPIFVLLASVEEEFESWVALSTEVLESARFGSSAPHPVPADVSNGLHRIHSGGDSWRFVGLPGVVVTPDRYAISLQLPGYLHVSPLSSHFGDAVSSVVRAATDRAGNQFSSVDEVVDYLEQLGATSDRVTVERLPDEDLDGQMASVLKVSSDDTVLHHAVLHEGADASFANWPKLRYAQMWLIETPIGPVFFSAEGETAEKLEVAVEKTQDLFAWVTFDCPTDSCRWLR